MAGKLRTVLLVVMVKLVFGHEGHHHGPEPVKDLGVWKDAHHVELKVLQGVDLKWLSTDSEYLTMEMSSFTKGYVSVGFCPKYKGTMEGCDIVIGWVDNQNGTAHLHDYYARANTLPELDASQDYELLEGTQDRGMTTIRFRRKWSTNDDPYDADLGKSNVRVMWAWHPEDPFSADSYFKHAGNSRGHMMEDISFKNPQINQINHHQEHLHSSAVYATSSLLILTLCLTFVAGVIRA